MARALLLAQAENERRQNCLRIERRRLRDLSDPLQLPETEFIAHFRLSKSGYRQVLEEVNLHLPSNQRRTAVRNELKVLAALNFYANGSYQRNVGASYLLNVSQPTMSKCLHEVTDALNAPVVLRKYIKFPFSQQDREIIMKDFMEKFGFPGIIGCIDGTHVAIIRPRDHEETYLNRKNYHSLNVLLICDANLTVLHVDASFGGASHDSYVWNQSCIKRFVEQLHTNGEHCWLLGDSGYAQRAWMMTPVLSAAPSSPEEHYTDLHCQVRNTVERCIGVLKARWRCLLAHRVLHYDPVTSGKIVNACVVLHNIANARNMPVPDPQHFELNNDQQPHHSSSDSVGDQDRHRINLIQRLWSSRSCAADVAFRHPD